MKRMLTGIKPTGRLHLGNYFGVIKDVLESQDDFDVFFLVADLHSLTSPNIQKNPIDFQNDIKDLIIDLVSLGINPDKVKIYRQSSHTQITTLMWIFNCLISLPSLERAHAFKDANTKRNEINAGLLTYPVLMAADILIADTDVVPVGPDQKQHLEISRDIARLFNNTYGDTFKEPKEKILTEPIIGTDGRKMSKSYKNTINIFADKDELKKSIMGIVTDSKDVNDKKDPKSCNIFQLHKLFNWDDLGDLEAKYKNGKISYKESKELLLERIWDHFSSAREKRAELLASNNVDKILDQNYSDINTQFENKLKEVSKKIGI